MKKIFLFILIFVLSKVCISQYPVTQYIGADSTLVQSRGGFKGRIVNTPFTDTAQANTQRISQYAGAMVFTTSNNGLWVRNSTATAWNLLASSGSSTNIYNSDGTITGTRVVELSTYPLSFVRNTYKQIAAEDNLTTLGSPNNIRRFTIYDDSVTLTGSDQSASSADSVLVRTASGRIKTRAQSAIAGATPTLQQVITAGSTMTSSNDIDINGHDFNFIDNAGGGTFGVDMEGVSTIGLTVTNTGDASTSMSITKDSLAIRPHLGRLNIDSLRSWSGISDTTYKKVMTWDTRNGRWEYSNWFGGSGAAVTTIGTINSQTKSANGAVISGTSLVMQTADATYPGLMTSADKLRLDSTSYLTIDKTFDSLAWGRNDSTFLVKSLRVQVNGSTVTPTKTDSTVSYNLTSLSLFPTSGIGTATSSIIGALGSNNLTVTSTAYPDGLFQITNSNGLVRFGDFGPAGNQTTFTLNDNSRAVSITSDGFTSISSSDSILLQSGSIRFRTLSNFADTSSWKAVVINNTTGEIRRATYWPGGGGGGSPAGNYGNVQLNRNGAFATPASDSLDFDAGLNIIGNLNASKFTWTGNSLYPYLALSGNDPLIYFGGTGAAYPSFGKSGGSAVIYGSSGTQSIGFYDQLIGGKQMLRLYSNGGGSAAVFSKTVISVDTAIGGPSDGSIMAIASRGDSTSLATGLSTHMFRGINSQYSNTNAANTFYGTVIYSNTNSSATGDHIVNWQSDAKKTGASTLDIIYHSAYLGDSIIAGTVNKRYGIKYWDAIVNGGAVLGSQMFIKVEKLKAATSNFDFLSDSAQTAKLDGNILLGDSTVAASARKTIHFFNGTAPSANISGAILYAESGELKVRDSGGNITTLSDPVQQSRVSTQFDATSTTTLANVTGLTANVDAGKIYRFEAKLYTTSNSSGGVKAAIAGTATATAIVYEGITIDAGLITQSRGTALGTAVGAVTAVTAGYITISGTITVNAAGTLTVQFAQNASNGTASSVLVGSTFVITEML